MSRFLKWLYGKYVCEHMEFDRVGYTLVCRGCHRVFGLEGP